MLNVMEKSKLRSVAHCHVSTEGGNGREPQRPLCKIWCNSRDEVYGITASCIRALDGCGGEGGGMIEEDKEEEKMKE